MSEPSQRHYPSPLRYPGGKRKVANYLKLLFLRNNYIGHQYVEPYAGGASVALSLLYEEYASHVHINDLNLSVYAFWDAVLNSTDELCRRIHDSPITMEEWHRQRSVQAAIDPDPLDLAFSTFFLNRTNRSGIIDGGVIGGKGQSGAWKMTVRFNKANLIRRVEKVARYSSRITLTKQDAAEYLRRVQPSLPEKTFLYLDPPYYIKGEGLYQHFYEHKDHKEIAGIIAHLTKPWIVSYDSVPEIAELYRGYDQIVYRLSYSAAEHYDGTEVMVFSPNIIKPSIDTPANIKLKVVDKVRKELLAAV